jgi:hypothetical protein
MTKAPYFHLAFRPNIALVSTVRRFIGEFYRRVLVDQELSPRLALATHELLENAVAYAIDDETEVRIEILEDQLVVKTWNRTLPERLGSVRSAIDEMNAEPDADKYYQQMLIRTSKRTDGSGLGLARIRAESEMRLGYEIDNDRVCIMATTIVTGGINA